MIYTSMLFYSLSEDKKLWKIKQFRNYLDFSGNKRTVENTTECVKLYLHSVSRPGALFK